MWWCLKAGSLEFETLCLLQWNAALAAFLMRHYASARCNLIFPFNSRKYRSPGSVVRGGMATVEQEGRTLQLPVSQPQLLKS